MHRRRRFAQFAQLGLRAPRLAPLLLSIARLAGLAGLAGLAACDTPDEPPLVLVGADPSDAPLAELSDEWLERFVDGDALFEQPMREGDGLGPVYIRQACVSCHEDDAKGPGSVTKLVIVEADGTTPAADQSGLPWGQTVRPYVAAGATTPIEAPMRSDLRTSRRIGPAVFGRGYLEAVADEEIERVAAEQADRDDGISGRVHYVPYGSALPHDPAFGPWAPGDEGLIGRFGVKARLATLEEFAADAAQGDMSLTSPMRPEELPNPDGLIDDALPGPDLGEDEVRLLADYVRLLAIPTRPPEPDPEGAKLFAEVRCDGCHVPSLRTRADYPIEPLADIDAPIYSDLLLHDMGEGLTDWLPEGDAGPQEWRTAPLMGLRHLRSFLHDGRATTLREAVLLHRSDGSEATDSIDRFERLSADDQARLLDFVSNL